MYLRPKFDVSSVILTSLERGGGGCNFIEKRNPKKPTKIRVKCSTRSLQNSITWKTKLNPGSCVFSFTLHPNQTKLCRLSAVVFDCYRPQNFVNLWLVSVFGNNISHNVYNVLYFIFRKERHGCTWWIADNIVWGCYFLICN